MRLSAREYLFSKEKEEGKKMQKRAEYKGYVVSVNAEEWCEAVWAGGYTVTVQSTGEMVREMPDTVVRKTYQRACTAALLRGIQYIERTLLNHGVPH
jgi:hypothetical protein